MTVGPTSLIGLRKCLLLGLTALAAWLSVKLIMAVLAPSSVWEPVEIRRATSIASTADRSYDFSYNPFAAGNSDDQGPALSEPVSDAPETTLNLQLKGLRSGYNGTAFIRTPDGQEDNYYIGEEILSGVFLRGVFPGYVLIDVNGQTQRLTTEDAKLARAQTRQPASSQRNGLQTLRSADAQTLLSQVEILPSFDSKGNRNGLTVRPRNSAIDLSTFGLRDGDVITQFAGQSVVSGMPDPVAIRRSVGNGRPVRVDLIRDGQPMTITIGSSS